MIFRNSRKSNFQFFSPVLHGFSRTASREIWSEIPGSGLEDLFRSRDYISTSTSLHGGLEKRQKDREERGRKLKNTNKEHRASKNIL
ncbi:hypothetical protein MSHOH_1978 [Methanosarcina horonobensis HB-1 = JCM 15518]|uniref:Uncharacterized protein n=1 Tax=Methanosarcina horonobensis HB-1 = JCM 15518 TaxID=1434110 RepID=A0A0E3SC90_9EURY|nr:hypothetical protein MSHOH_1978 [Methanosarcina horonobensis HB-1 = JCM 15518]